MGHAEAGVGYVGAGVGRGGLCNNYKIIIIIIIFIFKIWILYPFQK